MISQVNTSLRKQDQETLGHPTNVGLQAGHNPKSMLPACSDRLCPADLLGVGQRLLQSRHPAVDLVEARTKDELRPLLRICNMTGRGR
jgi:hypothetical protein